MKCAFIFFLSDRDPNGVEYCLKNINNATTLNENITIIVFISGYISINLPKSENYLIINKDYKNLMHALNILIEQYGISEDLFFILQPGFEIEFSKNIVDKFYQAYLISKAGFIISNHYEISKNTEILHILKNGHDPSSIIIPTKVNNPMIFYHGPLIVISRQYLIKEILNSNINYAYDYALRMGVISQGGTIFTIQEPLYSFKRGILFYPGYEAIKRDKKTKLNIENSHFNYLTDPGRFEWCDIIFKDYLIKKGYYLHDSYFSKLASRYPPNGISFITPTYNREKLIKYAVESFISTYREWANKIPIELIIVDNGYDNTKKVLSDYVNKYKTVIKYYKVSNLTLGEVRNFGVQRSKYNIIGQLDSDDILINDPVLEIFEQFKKTKAALIIGSYQIAIRDLDSDELKISDRVVNHDEFLVHHNNPLLQFCIPGYGAPRYFRKEVFKKVGGFPPLNYGEDTVFIDKIIRDGYIIKRNLSKPQYVVIRHSENTDNKSIAFKTLIDKNRAKYTLRCAILEEIKHKIEGNNSLKN